MQPFCILTATAECCPLFRPEQLRMLQHLYLEYGPCIPLSAVHMYGQQQHLHQYDAADHIAQELVQWHSMHLHQYDAQYAEYQNGKIGKTTFR